MDDVDVGEDVLDLLDDELGEDVLDLLDDELGESVYVVTDTFELNFLRGRHLRSDLPFVDDVVPFDLVDFFVCPVIVVPVLDADVVLDEPSSEIDSIASKAWPS